MAATIRDIKEMTGLSLATISKYLNGGNLLPENKEKIEKVGGSVKVAEEADKAKAETK